VRFEIDGAGEAFALLIGRLGAAMIGDEVGERSAGRGALGLELFVLRSRECGSDCVAGEGPGRIGRRFWRGRIGQVVEAERFDAQGAAGMIYISDGRGG
jgi:hypothetical protein